MRVAARVGHDLLRLLPTLLLVTVLIFVLLHLLPGDPASALLGEHGTPATIAALRRSMGLDRPLVEQYLLYLDRLAHGDLGMSVTQNVPVLALIELHLPVTLMLTGMAIVLAVLIAVPLALLAATRPGSPADMLVRALSQIGLSMPIFYLGLVLLIVFAAGLHLFPVGGIGGGFLSDLHDLFLPALTLALSLAAVLVRSLRAALLEVLHAEFVAFAHAKGLSARLVLWRHVLRNALISTVTLLGLNLGQLVGGAVITETVFAVPGIGRMMIESIIARDYAVVQSLTLVLAVLVSLAFVATDALQAALDPRVGR